MIRIFHGNDEKSHKSFQAWRKANVDGFHMTKTPKARQENSRFTTQDKRKNSEGRG